MTRDAMLRASEGGAEFTVINEFLNARQDACLLISSKLPGKRVRHRTTEPQLQEDRSEEWAQMLKKAEISVKKLEKKMLKASVPPWRYFVNGMKRWYHQLFIFLTLFLTGSTLSFAQPNDPESSAVNVPRLEASIQVDGVLNELVWENAVVLNGFWQYMPVDGRRSTDSTEVLVWYSPTAIHFGIRAYALSETVRSTLADRDKIEGDDYLLILLDTFNDQRQAFVFGVNPLGVQADGILRDASRRANMMGGGARGAYIIDLNPDFVYRSQGRLTRYGYEVEIQVPFKSLRYQAMPSQDWGFNVIVRCNTPGTNTPGVRCYRRTSLFWRKTVRFRVLRTYREGSCWTSILKLPPVWTVRHQARGGNTGEGNRSSAVMCAGALRTI